MPPSQVLSRASVYFSLELKSVAPVADMPADVETVAVKGRLLSLYVYRVMRDTTDLSAAEAQATRWLACLHRANGRGVGPQRQRGPWANRPSSISSAVSRCLAGWVRWAQALTCVVPLEVVRGGQWPTG